MAATWTNFEISIFLLIFVLNILISNVESLKIAKESEFKWFVSSHDHVLAYFYDDTCSSSACLKSDEHLATLVEESSHSFSRLEVVKISSDTLNKDYGISSLPSLVFFRKSYPVTFFGDMSDVDDVTMWLELNRDVSTRTLYEDDFEHLTQSASGATTGDWFILFYTPECDSLISTWEAVALRLKHRMNIAKVDVEANKRIQERFKIESCPTIIYFRHGKMFEYTMKEADYNSYINFAEGWYKNVKSQRVPSEPTPFDNLVDSIVTTLKSYQEQPYGPGALGFFCVIFMTIGLIFLGCCLFPSKKTEKLE